MPLSDFVMVWGVVNVAVIGIRLRFVTSAFSQSGIFGAALAVSRPNPKRNVIRFFMGCLDEYECKDSQKTRDRGVYFFQKPQRNPTHRDKSFKNRGRETK